MKNFPIAFMLLLSIALVSCKQENKPQKSLPQPEANPYIQSYNGGQLSGLDELVITFAQEVNIEAGSKANGVLTIVPKVVGDAVWETKNKIVFHPQKRLKPGQIYNISLDLSMLFPEISNAHKSFQYSIQVVKRDFEVYVSGVFADTRDEKLLNVKGFIEFSDFEKEEDLERILMATHLGVKCEVNWEQGSNSKRWRYLISNIQRQQEETELELAFNAKQMGIDKEVLEKVKIPAVKGFRLMNMRAVQANEQYLILEFSNAIDKKQNLEGLVKIEGAKNLRSVVSGNRIKLYFENRLYGSKKVEVFHEIRSVNGNTLNEKQEETVLFEAIKPNIRFVGKGVIVPPTGKGAIVSFETVNLSAVDLFVIQIYEKNVPQFLQDAQLDSKNRYELQRTGRLILKKKIDLVADHVLNYGKWNAFSFDLSELIKTEPGALYRLDLQMNKDYSTYPCDEPNDPESTENKRSQERDTPENWDNISYWPIYRNYNWRDRDNACSESYYNSRNFTRNVLVSDIGIVAKNDAKGNYRFYINSLETANAISGAQLQLLNYQGIEITKGNSNDRGLVELKPQQTPYLAIVSKAEQKGYLRLDARSRLSYSNFDVSGQVVQKGLKGFIYGERGVWRPGDSIYLNFILEDKLATLPENHPVTFTLTNPNGQLAKRMVSTKGINGFYPFHINTQADDPTGLWMAKVSVGDADFYKRIRIETVKPNRLKVKLDFGSDTIYANKTIPKGNISVKWLHGAIAKNISVKTELSFSTSETKFKGYYNYSFDDPSKVFKSEAEEIFDSKTDELGNTSFPILNKSFNNAPGVLKAKFFTRAFESGGDFSTNIKTAYYSPYSAYVGVRLPELDEGRYFFNTDQTVSLDIATVNAKGEPIDAKNVEVRLYKISWRWWWSSGNDNLANYVGRNSHSVYKKLNVNTTGGKGKASFKVNKNDWGRYFVHVSYPSGHSCGKTMYFDWPYGNRKNGPGGATQLTFTSNKTKYEVGESATINLPGGDGARALVSIENGSETVEDFWVDLNDDQNKVSFRTTAAMAPNIFVNVMLIQPHANTLNDNPIRMYGAIPIVVEDPQTILKPVLELNDVLRPEQEVKIKVSEENDKDITYTIAVVDDGLLDLTNFKTPDPHNTFYAREAHGVKTWDMYNYVTGAYGGQIEKIFAIGGDEDIHNESSKKANRFKPVVKCFGPFILKGGKTAEHKFTMPRYVGSVRTMVVAGAKGAYGKTDKTSLVRNPLMITGTLPRVLGPGETVKLPVSVFAMEEDVKQVSIAVETNEMLQLKDKSIKEIGFTQIEEKEVEFELQVGQQIGIARVNIVAKSGRHIAKYDIELDVRYPNQEVTRSALHRVNPGETLEELVALPGIAGSNRLSFEISGIPPVNLSKRMQYLVKYPYGCIEQTTSSVFPQLYLSQFKDLSGNEAEEIQRNVTRALTRLQKFQVSGGGFSYWPGGTTANEWGSNYAGHFMLEAEKAGYALPAGMKKQWLKFQKNEASTLNQTFTGSNRYYYSLTAQAYRLYTLALAGSPSFGAMNRLKGARKLTKQAKWRLALAYAHAGRLETALELIDVRDLDVEDYIDMQYSYGSAFRDRAMLLETLTTSELKDEAFLLAQEISKVLSSDKWLSTQETAWALNALAKFYKSLGKTADKGEYKLMVEGERKKEGSIEDKVVSYDFTTKGTQLKSSFENTGKKVLFVNVVSKGVPEPGTEQVESKYLKMNVRYVNDEGHLLNVARLTQGTDFKAIVEITYEGVNSRLDNLVLNQVFPSGWEIINTRLFDLSEETSSIQPDYQDIRDDRAYTFFALPKGKRARFEIRLNAAYAGRYYLPQVSVEAMYSDNYYARNKGKWVEVVKE